MAKNKKIKKKEQVHKPKQKEKSGFMITLENWGAKAVFVADVLLDKAFELAAAGWVQFKKLSKIAYNKLTDIAAGIVVWYDHIAAVVSWFLTKTIINLFRSIHFFRMELKKYRRQILRSAVYFVAGGVLIVGLIAYVTDYEYAYNGRTLGVVKEQTDVLEILDLVSEELSMEYGSNIHIDPETDISFKPVISYGRDIDKMDDVLQKFTYMGDIQATAYAIIVDGERMAIVESEKIAQSILDSILTSYLKDDDTEYEYVGFAENVKIEPYSTTLANVSSKSATLKKFKNGGQAEETYKVVSGDTIYGICDKLDLTFKELKAMNPDLDMDDTLHIGDKFVIKKEVPLLTVETVEVSTFAESIDYEVVYKESSSYYIGDQVVSRAGKKGKARVTARLTKQNGKTVEREDLKTVVITEPVDKIIVKGTKVPPPKKGTGTFIRPVNVGVYRGWGMRWGRMHYGLDYAASTGTSIYASDGGTVTTAGWHGNYGYYIKIDHGGGFTTLYAHCSKLLVKVGDKVYQGQRIGLVGNTGRSTGPHCHFEIFKYGKNVNPSNYVR
ncbi:MAG: peptidoglycan DD-metalloendopeptidase family protein [Firmicutes bacterium]|nr:peptidoglycan DD-metalloendopeptidase family protein [Bacillota bacterium]MBR6585767.1 peptidoglycan DD-metalloendopeptidase family protein [Bacillota bacterium]